MVSVEPEGRSAAITTDGVVVLASSLPAAHDQGFQKSRILAVSLCESIVEVARGSVLDQAVLANLVDALFSSTQWMDWHVSFCVAAREGPCVRAFNCGVAGLALTSAEGITSALLAPNTLGRKLRREGVASVPAHLENVGLVAGRGLRSRDIGYTEVELAECISVLAFAEPRMMDHLSELSAASTELDALRDAIEATLAPMNNPTRSFALWSPSSGREAVDCQRIADTSSK